MSDDDQEETFIIDFIRFVYDILRNSALQFGIQEQSIAVWEGPANDYGVADFIAIISRLIHEDQIGLRYQLNRRIQDYYLSHMSNSLEHIKELLEYAIRFTTDDEKDIITHARFALATTCELIQFLYTINSDLFVIQLAKHLFYSYFKRITARFERQGGLFKLYQIARRKEADISTAFLSIYISAYCKDYENSASDEDIYNRYCDSVALYKKKHYQLYASGTRREDGSCVITRRRYVYAVPEQDEGVDLPPNPGLGVPQPHEMYDFPLADDAALSESTLKESGQELSKHTKRSSHRDRIRNKRSSLRPSLEQDLGQLSLGTKQSSETTDTTQSYRVSGTTPEDPAQSRKSSDSPDSDFSGMKQSSETTDTTQSCVVLGAKPKVPEPLGKSSKSKKKKSSLRAREGQLNPDSSITKQSSETTDITQSLGSKPKVPEPLGKSSKSKKKKSSLRAREGQDLGQLNPDCSIAKQSSETPDTTQSSEALGAKPKVPVRHKKSSESKKKKSNLRPSLEQDLGQMNSDSSITKQSSETPDTTQSCEALGAKSKVPEPLGKSSKSKKSSLRPRQGQDLGQLNSDSSITKLSSETTDTTQSCEALGAKPKVPARHKKSSESKKKKSTLRPRKGQDLGKSSSDSSGTKLFTTSTFETPSVDPFEAMHKFLGQVILDFSGTKQSNEEKSDILGTNDQTSQNYPGTSTHEPTKGSSNEEETDKKETQE